VTVIQSALERIRGSLRGRSVPNAPMHEHTTIRVGGPVDLLVYPSDRDDLVRLMALLAECRVPFLALGNGSNLVIRDRGVRGVAVSLREGLKNLERRAGSAGRPTVWAGAGLPLQRFVRWTAEQGIGGFEALCGIPATLGGALAMNAGAWGFEIGERVIEVETLGPEGELSVVHREALQFGYRSLGLPPGHIVVGALLEGEEAEPVQLKARLDEFQRRRCDSQPLDKPSAGSVFKNPRGHSAGRLIEECGLKGARVGGARISPVHANFIVNEGGATAENIVRLMATTQECVHRRHGLKLEPEVRIVGEQEER